MPWVRLRSAFQREINGKVRHYQPDDWLEVPNQLAMRLLADGRAVIPDYDARQFVGVGCGVLAVGALHDTPEQLGRDWGVEVQQTDGFLTAELPFHKTLLWHTTTPFQPLSLPAGFTLLDTWQVAAPLRRYDQLAVHRGNEVDRQATAAVIHDLRVPVYETGLLFLRRCETTTALLAAWREEWAIVGLDRDLAFLRALWRVKPLVLPLPFHWATADGRDGYDR